MTKTRRDFIDTDAGQFHVVSNDRTDSDKATLVMVPQMSALEQVRLMVALDDRPMVAIDPLGLGDSDPVPWDSPTIEDHAAALLSALTELNIDRFDLYGSHFGARVAAEMAVVASDRVGHLILDGAGHLEEPFRSELIEHYAPPLPIDQHGSQLRWSWHFVRDSFLFWPHFSRDPAHARMVGIPSADALHDRTVQVLKNAHSFDKNLRAAFSYPTHEKLPRITCQTLLSKRDAPCAALIPNAQQSDHEFYDSVLSTDDDLAAWAGSIRALLDNS